MSIRRSEYLVGTTTEWAVNNGILSRGQVGVDSVLGITKIGDGVTAWADLIDEGETSGAELGYADTVTTFTTTSTTGATALIPGLALTIVGQGRPVDVEFFVPGAWHSVANTGVIPHILLNDGSDGGTACYVFSPKTDSGPSALLKRRIVLSKGVTYTFKAALYGAAAGTSTVSASIYGRAYLSAVSR